MQIIDIGLIVTFLGMISEGITIYILWRKLPKEMDEIDANTVDKYASAASNAIDMSEKLSIKVTQLEKVVDDLEKKIDDLEKQITEKDKIINEWAIGIDKLIHQICSYNEKPVWNPEISLIDMGNDIIKPVKNIKKKGEKS